MTDLNEIAVFVSVAQLGSFTGAARALSMPVSTVSRRIADLEQQLGVTLIQRTTRKLILTAQGRDYFDQCSEPLAHLYDAERVLTHSQRQPEGILRISVPVILGDPVFLGFLSDFLRNHPRIRLDLFITNQMLDLVAESIDVALRIGELKSSSIVARKLGTTVRYVVAAPAYLAGRARPREPAELAEHACVLLNAVNNEAEWELVNDRHRARVRVIGAAASRDFQSLSFFVGRGHGIGLMPSTYCDSQIENGTLVRLLPKWSSPPVSVHAVYPTRKFLPEKMRVFLQGRRDRVDGQGDRPRHPVDREVPDREEPAVSGLLEVARFEGDEGILRHVEEIGAAQMFVALCVAGIDRCRFDGDIDAAASEVSIVDLHLARDRIELTTNRCNHHVLNGKASSSVRTVDQVRSGNQHQ